MNSASETFPAIQKERKLSMNINPINQYKCSDRGFSIEFMFINTGIQNSGVSWWADTSQQQILGNMLLNRVTIHVAMFLQHGREL